MSTLYYNSYLVKVATKGEGGQKFPKSGYVVCVWPLRSHRGDSIAGALSRCIFEIPIVVVASSIKYNSQLFLRTRTVAHLDG